MAKLMEGVEIYSMDELSPEVLDNIIASAVGEPNMTDNYEQQPTQTHTEVDPMGRVKDFFADATDAFVQRTRLGQRVQELEKIGTSDKARIVELMTERDSLKAENRNLQDVATVLKEEVGYKEALLNRTRDNLADVMRKRDTVQTQLDATTKDLDAAKEDKELVEMERDEWKDKADRSRNEFETTTAEFREAREKWADQEEHLNTIIDNLTVERDKYRDKFDRAKSHAASIMQLDHT